MDLANEIDNALHIKGIRVTRDTKNVKCAQSFKEFMKSIRNHDLALMLISDHYLKSQACMFEVIEFMKKPNYKQRIIAVVNDDINFDLKGITYLKYWEEKGKLIEEAIKEHHYEKIKPLKEERDEIKLIEDNIMEFISTIRDLKYIPFKELYKSYPDLYGAIGLKINKSEEIYDIITEEDVSFGLARRHSINVLINKDYPKCEIKTALKKIVSSLKQANDVIWIFVYNELKDVSSVNWFCQGYWVSSNLDQTWRPIGITSNDRIEDIEIRWNEGYENWREIYKPLSGTKNEIIKWSETLLEKVIPIAKTAVEKFDLLQSSEINKEEFLEYMHKNRKTVQELYSQSGERKYPPYECREYILKFDNLFAIVDNIFLFHSKENMDTWPEKTRMIMTEQEKNRYYKVLEELNYERNKLN
jgi:hypothetical protein